MRRDAPLGRLVVLVAGIGLGQAWLIAGAQKPAGSADLKPAPMAQKSVGEKVSGPGCSERIVVPDESFRALQGGGLRDASVWVDDIDTGLFGGYQPFNVFVVTGRLYAPFQLAEGKLGRDNFVKFTAKNYNTVTQGPLVVSMEHPQGQLGFVQDDRRYSLRVVEVQTSTFNRDAIIVQVCW
jgi:hypothetical protein